MRPRLRVIGIPKPCSNPVHQDNPQPTRHDRRSMDSRGGVRPITVLAIRAGPGKPPSLKESRARQHGRAATRPTRPIASPHGFADCQTCSPTPTRSASIPPRGPESRPPTTLCMPRAEGVPLRPTSDRVRRNSPDPFFERAPSPLRMARRWQGRFRLLRSSMAGEPCRDDLGPSAIRRVNPSVR